MGDRTWVNITYAKADEKAVLEAFGWSKDARRSLNTEEHDGIATAYFYEVNWGGLNEMMDLAKKGVTFTAHAGAGGSYGESLNVGYRGEFMEASAHEGEPACLVRENGKADREGMEHIRTYIRLARKANREMERIQVRHKEAA